MTSATVPDETITSDPVVIEASDAQNSASGTIAAPVGVKAKVEDVEARLKNLEQTWEKHNASTDNTFRPAPRVIERERCHSPYIIRRQQEDEFPTITNTAGLNAVLDEPDVSVEVQSGPRRYSTHIAYVANTPFHAADIEKVSWVLTNGVSDAWVQKPSHYFMTNVSQFDLPPPQARRRDDFYDERYDDQPDRGFVPIIRLGSALKVFRDDTEEYQTSKVKFLTVVQGRNNARYAKLIISHSRQSAMVDILHQIINSQSILFVGAMLRDVPMPLEDPGRVPAVKFQRVGSVKEAEEVGDGVIGVIC